MTASLQVENLSNSFRGLKAVQNDRFTEPKGEISEANGFNCTQGSSGYPSPCTVTKAGATQIVSDAVDNRGRPVPLYVNVVSAAAPKLSVDVTPADVFNVSPLTGLRVLRFSSG